MNKRARFPGGTGALADIVIVLLNDSEPPIVADTSLCNNFAGMTVDTDIEYDLDVDFDSDRLLVAVFFDVFFISPISRLLLYDTFLPR